jgi:nucleoside-diphosphate-sugar epimerase
MKVCLTGGNGFVGSHILDGLQKAGMKSVVLLRRTGDTRFIARHLDHVDICYGSLGDLDALTTALHGAEAVVHCAGKTKVTRNSEYDEINDAGTQHIVAAVNSHARSIRHFIHISSLAVSGPGTMTQPARESAPPQPVSAYGRSKLAGETAVRKNCRVAWTILRPAAVYGPRDRDFLNVFKAVKLRLMPLFDGGHQPLSLAFAPDVATAVLACLGREKAYGKIYHVAATLPCSNQELLQEIAAQMVVRPWRVTLPRAVLYPLGGLQEVLARLTGRPSILSRDKVREILAPGWVCATEKIEDDLGFSAPTPLYQGVAQTLDWYRRQRWL